jgi:hypothetical protein
MAEPREILGSMRLGRFELSVDTGELRKDGVQLKLSDQAIQVLAMLAANAAIWLPAYSCSSSSGPTPAMATPSTGSTRPLTSYVTR